MTTQSTDLSWREGDVYFWRYRYESQEFGDFTTKYWCCARMAIIVDGILHDIYWMYINGHKLSDHGTHGRYWMPIEAKDRLILLYKGNLDQFDAIADYNEPLYAEADILDLRHANSSQKQIYLRKGAMRSKGRMLEHCRYLREKAESALRSAQHNVQRYAEIEAEIEAGADLNKIYL